MINTYRFIQGEGIVKIWIFNFKIRNLVYQFLVVCFCRYVCNCTDTGFNGTYCENNIDDCTPDPCQHNSTCIDGIKVGHSTGIK